MTFCLRSVAVHMTFHPASRRSLQFFRSLSTFPRIFFVQYSVFDAGQTNLGQSCLCQKQPLTKMTVRYFGRTMSGFPGSFATFFRYRKPCANRYLRTNSSGFEFLLRIWDMFFLRSSDDRLSAIHTTPAAAASPFIRRDASFFAIAFAIMGGTALPTC